MKLKHKKGKADKGQAIMLVVVAMGIVLVGGLGLAIDGSQIYAHTQMAQAAADAAAMAGILSMLQGVNTISTNPAKFPTNATFTCTAADFQLPCQYARLNGFGTGDTVTVNFSGDSLATNPATLASCPMPTNPCCYGD